MRGLTQLPPSMLSTANSVPGAVLKDTGVVFEPSRDDTSPSSGVKTMVYDRETGTLTTTNVDGTIVITQGLPTANNIGVGATGPTGPEGTQGNNGRNGKDGRDGPMGCIGPKGDVGPAGPAGGYGGIGPRGPIGPTGPQGAQGLPGLIGPTGPEGPQGTIGPQGLPGQAGPTGPQGVQGFTGVTGPQGDKGENGAAGAIGPTGPQGIDGARGIQGPPGETGPIGQGIPGPAGSASLFVYATWKNSDARVGTYTSIESGDNTIEVAGRFHDTAANQTVTINYEFNGQSARNPLLFISANKGFSGLGTYTTTVVPIVEGNTSGQFIVQFSAPVANLDFNWRILMADAGVYPVLNIPATSMIRTTSSTIDGVMEYTLNLDTISSDRILVDWETISDDALGTNIDVPNSVPTMDFWHRASGPFYYPIGSDYAQNGDAGAFVYAGGKISVNRKTEDTVSLLSPVMTKQVSLETVMSSTSADDNTLGVVIAHVRKDGVNHQLVAMRNQGGAGGLSPTKNFMLVYLRNNLVRKVVGAIDIGTTTGAWSGKTTKVRVTRAGNVYAAQASGWNSATLDAAVLQVDVSTDVDLAVFKEHGRFGFFTYAQTDSTFDSIVQGSVVADFVTKFGTMEFLPGETTKTIQVVIKGTDNPTPPPLTLKMLPTNPRYVKLSTPPYGVGTF